MYFTKLRLNGLEVIDLPVVHAKPSDAYILKSADGLGPSEIDVSIVETLNAGGVYQGRRPNTKEVVILVGLNPNHGAEQTASDLRATLYGLLTPGVVDRVKIELMDEEASLAFITGYVKKMEIVPFNQNPEVQVTFACLEQYWTTSTLIYLDPGDKVHPIIPNVGTAPSGFHMEVIFTTSMTSWTLMDDIGHKMQIDYSFLAGDRLSIDTRPGQRGIWLDRAATTHKNIIYALSADSIWLMLHGGDNQFHTNLQTFNWGDVAYLPQYWGV